MLSNCPECNVIHVGRCPYIKSIEYHENGTIKKVEYFDHVHEQALRALQKEA